MSCCNSSCNCGCDPCSNPDPIPVGSQYESLSSALDNFIYYFYGEVTKTVVDGEVVWTLPCDLSTGIPGYPRDPAVGTACYFKDLFALFGSELSLHDAEISAAVSIANATATQAAALASEIATYGDIVTQNHSAVNLTGGLITGVTVTGLPTPVAGSDAATKSYADSIAAGINPQLAVRVASTGNVNLAASGGTIDGVALTTGDRVLLRAQTAPAENGIYTINTGGPGTLTRATDADTAGELSLNRYYFTLNGTVYAGTGWFISTEPVVLGTDPVQFSVFSVTAGYTNGVGLTLTGAQFAVDFAVVMRRSNNLSDVASVATSRSNLGVSATGADTTYAFRSNNLSDLANVATARSNLGVTATGADSTYNARASNLADVANAAAARSNLGVSATGTDANYNLRSNNLSDVLNSATARANLGLGSIATQSASAVAITGGSITNLSALSPLNLSSLRTIKRTNFNLNVNVKDYGAVGNGVADDTAAINAAIAALTSYSSLYFPAGLYLITGGLTQLTGIDHVSIYGDGRSSQIHSNVTGAAGNTFVVTSSCSYIAFHDLVISGSATVRGNGIHIRLYSSLSSVTNCFCSGCSDFAIHVHNDAGGYNYGTSVIGNTISGSLGDGIHFGAAANFVCSDNFIANTGDDGIGVIADVLAQPPTMGLVSNNVIQSPGGLASAVSGCGIRVADGAADILISNNTIQYSRESSINICRFASTTAFCNRISIIGNKTYNSTTHVGPRGAIWIQFVNESCVTDNELYDTAYGTDICFLDFNDLTIRGNTCRGTPLRPISSDDSTTANVRVNWYGLMIVENVIQWNQSNETIYVVPAVGIQINNIIIQANVGNELTSAGDWIFCARVATGKITNNTSRDGRGITTGGLTAVNNN